MRVFAVDQGSPEWLQLRTGVATASRAKDVLATLKSGAPAQARQDYACELAIERITGSMVEHFVNGAMQRGTDLEPEARAAYEAETKREERAAAARRAAQEKAQQQQQQQPSQPAK